MMGLIVAAMATLAFAQAPGGQPKSASRAAVEKLMAAERGDTDEVRALVAGKDPNARDAAHQRTALMWSIFLQDQAAFDRFMVAGADVNAVDDSDETALMHAAEFAMQYDTLPMVEALLAKGAAAGARSPGPAMTPLMHAANANNPAIARALLAKIDPKDVDQLNGDGMTALIIACSVGAKDVAWALIEKGAKIDGYDVEGKTPLLYAAGHKFPGSADTVKLLLDMGANPELKDKQGNTALSEAKKYGPAEAVQMLEKASRPPLP